MITVQLINESTLLSDADLAAMLPALQAQYDQHLAPAWNLGPAHLVIISKAELPNPSAMLMAFLDDSDQAGALGYHAETPGGLTFSRIFCRPSLESGSTALRGAYSISSVASHELCEMMVDPATATWVDGPRAAEGDCYALEVCDPVEADCYELAGAMVSNFVYPAWFDPNAAGGKFDHIGTAHAAFTMSPGGYMIIRFNRGEENQVIAQQRNAYRRPAKLHPAARTYKRLGY